MEVLADRWSHSPRSTNPHLEVSRITAELWKPWSLEIVITMVWCIWKYRNRWIFNEIHVSITQCKGSSLMPWYLSPIG
jgi:hypothetical protein